MSTTYLLRRYTSKMLLAAIDENHKGTYDFLYLPIDFKVTVLWDSKRSGTYYQSADLLLMLRFTLIAE